MGSYALFDMPRGISYHQLGFLAVCDSQNACIRRISLDGALPYHALLPPTRLFFGNEIN